MSGQGQTEITILLVDDHPVVRQGYRRVLERHGGLKVTGEADSAADAYRLYKELRPDVVVLDLSLPGASGLEALHNIRQRDPRARILIFSMHANPMQVKAAFDAGASGYVTKSNEPTVLVDGVRRVIRGERVMSDDIAQLLAHDSLRPKAPENAFSRREIEILRHIANGATKEEIAASLNISIKTVQNCHYIIKTKIGAKTDAQLVRFAFDTGICERSA